ITAAPATASVGTTFSVTVQTRDTLGNVSAVGGDTDVQLDPSGAGTLSGNTTTISGGSSGATLNAVNYDTPGTITLTATRTSGDTLSDSAPSSSIDVRDRPTTTLAFPAATAYGLSSWAAGCATAGFCGTVTDNSGTGIDVVEVSIRRAAGNYWNGSAFGSASELFFPATVSGGDWSFAFPAGDFPADDDYTVRVRATDNLGAEQLPLTSRTFTIDATAPSSVVSFPASGSTYRTATWNDPSGTASDATSGLDRVEVSIRRVSSGQYWNGTAFADPGENWRTATGTGSWSLTFPPSNFTADGDYVLRVRSVDEAGNAETPTSYTVTVDQTAPETTIDSAPPSFSNDDSPQFVFSSEPGATFECKLDGAAFAPCTSPVDHSALAESAHTFQVRATDGAGNTDASPASHTWTIDLTDPTSAFSFPANGTTYNAAGWSNPAGTASDAGGAALDKVEVSLQRVTGGLYWDGGAFASGTQEWHEATGDVSWSFGFDAADFPADGDYTISVRATDTAGNVETPSSRTFTVDTVAPETTIDSAPPAASGSTDADFTFSADEPGSTFECKLDAGAWSSCTSPQSFTLLNEGSHTFQARATDGAGNTETTPASHTWVVDIIAPILSMDDPGLYLSDTVELTGSASDPGGSGIDNSTVKFQRSPASAGTWTDTPASWDTTAVANGQYDLRLVGSDNAGNPGASSPYTAIWVDNAAPTVSVVDPGPVMGTVVLTANAADSHSGVKVVRIEWDNAGTWTSLGDDTSAPYEGSWSTGSLLDGTYDVRAIAEDNAGNIETSAITSILVDNQAPVVDFTDPVEGGFVNAADADPYTVVATATDGGSGVDRVEFYDGPTLPGSDSAAPYEASFDVDADGEVTLTAKAYDEAGHESTTDVTFTVDRTAPDTTIVMNPGDPSNDATPEFTFSSTEPGSTFECQVDGGGWSACTSPHTTATLGDASHTFEVRATDEAGNTDGSSASWTWLVDTTPPTATMDDPGANLRQTVTLTESHADPGANASGFGPSPVVFEYSVADAETWVSTPPAWDTTLRADGLYDLRTVVTDLAGNSTISAVVEDRRIDNTPPATAIEEPPANMRQTVTLRGSASDPDPASGVQDVTFEISVDGTSWTPLPGVDATDPYETAFDSTTFADGLYYFRTVARDVAGNVTEGAPSSLRRIDNTAPIGIMNDPGSPLRGAVSLTSTADDPGGSGVDTVVYHYTGPETGTTSGTWATDSIADGLYDLHVVVTDVAGNVTTSNVVGGRRVDNTPPSTTDNAPSGWQSSAVTVTLSPSDGGSGVSNTTYAVDGGAPVSGTWATDSIADGLYDLHVVVTDVAGNVTTSNVVGGRRVDNTPPVTTDDAP
ncbi:MAG TPA: Ig-like domain-containing protein, partial [Actinomycetota bacterium]